MKWGQGKNVELVNPWEQQVAQDHLLWSEYGCPIDLRKLPRREYQAHVAIIQGINKEREKQNKKAEREANQANKFNR